MLHFLIDAVGSGDRLYDGPDLKQLKRSGAFSSTSETEGEVGAVESI